jgi:hypothetical protein
MTQKIILISKNDYKYSFDASVLSTQLQDYLASRFSLEYMECYFCKDRPITSLDEEVYYEFMYNCFTKNSLSHGLEALDILPGYLDYYISNKDTEKYFDLRNYRFFMEHKIMMYKRWDYLTTKGYLNIDKNTLNNFNIRARKASMIFYALGKMCFRSVFDTEKLIKYRNGIKEIITDESIELKYIAEGL